MRVPPFLQDSGHLRAAAVSAAGCDSAGAGHPFPWGCAQLCAGSLDCVSASHAVHESHCCDETTAARSRSLCHYSDAMLSLAAVASVAVNGSHAATHLHAASAQTMRSSTRWSLAGGQTACVWWPGPLLWMERLYSKFGIGCLLTAAEDDGSGAGDGVTHLYAHLKRTTTI